MKKILLTFDGGAKPNPGKGYGSFHIREVALMMNNSGDSFGWSELY